MSHLQSFSRFSLGLYWIWRLSQEQADYIWDGTLVPHSIMCLWVWKWIWILIHFKEVKSVKKIPRNMWYKHKSTESVGLRVHILSHELKSWQELHRHLCESERPVIPPLGAEDGLVLDPLQRSGRFKTGMKGARTTQRSPLFDSSFWERAKQERKKTCTKFLSSQSCNQSAWLLLWAKAAYCRLTTFCKKL